VAGLMQQGPITDLISFSPACLIDIMASGARNMQEDLN